MPRAQDAPGEEASDERAPGETLEVERHVVALRRGDEPPERSQRSGPSARPREGPAVDHVDGVETPSVLDDGRRLGFDGPAEPPVRERRAQQLERRERVHRVADRAQPDEEKAPLHADEPSIRGDPGSAARVFSERGIGVGIGEGSLQA